MINANELRIGNYINDMFGGQCECRGITHRGVYIRDQSGPAPENAFSGIPLTPEWLKRFGFIYQSGINDSYLLNGLELYGSPFEIGYEIEQIFGVDVAIIEKGKPRIEYVHQLQNLYFALTGEELTLKP